MPNEIFVALIAFIGVVLSVIASLYTSLRATRTELEALRSELRQAYTDRLLEKRLETYPNLYRMSSGILKEIQFGTLTNTKLDEWRDDLIEWDSANAIFLSMNAGSKLYDLRKRLMAELNSLTDEELADQEYLRTLRYQVEGLEIALKNDLGIYIVEFSDFTTRSGYYKKISQEANDAS